MGRHALKYPTHLLRARIRSTYREAVRQILARVNFFDPSKPAHGDMSNLIETLLVQYIKKHVTREEFSLIQTFKEPKAVTHLLAPIKGD